MTKVNSYMCSVTEKKIIIIIPVRSPDEHIIRDLQD